MKRILLLLFLLITVGGESALAQAHLVKGRVLDENGQGFPGAGVTVKGTQTGTVTDIDGNFQLNVPDGSTTLVIQAVGYGTQEVSATAANISVRLSPAAKELQGTVVTALGLKREKRELGYSSTTLSNEDLTNANNSSALSSLEGKVAGANITSSTGAPGGSVRVVLRGEKSLSTGNNAIIVIDGVIMNNYDRTTSLNGSNLTPSSYNILSNVDFGNSGTDVNPDDIESITVLDGPSAAALYGSIGANGAIMITTKSGKSNNSKKKTEITFKESYTLQNILKYPTFQNQFGEGNIYQGNVPNDPRENFSWGLPFDGQLRPWGQIINGQQLNKPYSAVPNNVKDFYNTGQTPEEYLSIAGGSDKSTYFLSLNALNNNGVVPNDYYNRYSVRFNGTTRLSNNFYSTVNITYLNTSSRVTAQGQNTGSVYNNINQIPRDIPVSELKNLNDPYYAMQYVDANGVNRYGYYGAYTLNPYWVADNFENLNVTDRVVGDVTIGFRPNNDLNVYDRIGGDVSSDRSTYKAPAFFSNPTDPYYQNPFYPHTAGGGFSQFIFNDMQLNNDLIIDYKKQLTDNLTLNITGGNNIRVINATTLSGVVDPATNGLILPGFYNFQNAQGSVQTNNSTTQLRAIGLYGDFKLGYKNRLFLEITGRNDWTSTLIEGNWSYFYPSISPSWVFTDGWNSGFTRNILTYGKIRASYSSVGTGAPAYANNNPGYVKTIASSAFGSVIFPFNTIPGYSIQSFIGDSTLRPERTNSYEVGTDLTFFHDRFNFSFTYYDNLTIDQIIQVPVPFSSGFGSREINVGTVRNHGVEMVARVTPISTPSGFRWDLFGNYTQNINEVVSLTGGASQITFGGIQGMGVVAAVGHPFGSFYSIDVQHDPNGNVVVNPANGIPLTTAQPVFKGTYQPKFIAAWGTDLKYKGFTLHLLFSTKQGGEYFSNNKMTLDFGGLSAETADNNRNPYVWPGSVVKTAAGTYVKNTTPFSPYNWYVNYESFIYSQGLVDASYIKLQEASLNYTLPDKWIGHGPFGQVMVGIYGTNLLIWTPKSNKYDDPEESSSGATDNTQGFNFTARPSLRSYGAFVKISF